MAGPVTSAGRPTPGGSRKPGDLQKIGATIVGGCRGAKVRPRPPDSGPSRGVLLAPPKARDRLRRHRLKGGWTNLLFGRRHHSRVTQALGGFEMRDTGLESWSGMEAFDSQPGDGAF